MTKFLQIQSELLKLKQTLQAEGVRLQDSKKYTALKVALFRAKPKNSLVSPLNLPLPEKNVTPLLPVLKNNIVVPLKERLTFQEIVFGHIFSELRIMFGVK